jgi:hypothetical protein
MPDIEDDPGSPAPHGAPHHPKGRFSSSGYLFCVLAPLACAALSGMRLLGDHSVQIAYLGFWLILPCTMVAGAMTAAHWRRMGRRTHVAIGVGTALGLILLDVVCLFFGCAQNFRF